MGHDRAEGVLQRASKVGVGWCLMFRLRYARSVVWRLNAFVRAMTLGKASCGGALDTQGLSVLTMYYYVVNARPKS